MATSKAQQAAIAISMKKAGKKPKSLTKAQNGKIVKPTADSTAYYKKEIKGFDQLIKSEPNTPIGKSNKSIYTDARSKAYSNLNRQSLKGKPGYDANGSPIKKKIGGATTTVAKAQKGKIIKSKPANGTYSAFENGRVGRTHPNGPYESMDTTGYSKGKQEFDLKTSFSGFKPTSEKVKRKDVPSIISGFKKGATRTEVKSKKKK